MPTLPGDQQPSAPQHHPHIQRPQHVRSVSYQVQPSSSQISPLSTSDETQHNASLPGSPKAYHARQTRPLYMPAVLRPNSDFKQKVTRARTAGHCGNCDCTSGRRLSNGGGIMNVPGLATIQRLSRRSTGESTKCPEGGWDLELFPEVTDVPTRNHWKVSSSPPPFHHSSLGDQTAVSPYPRARLLHAPHIAHLCDTTEFLCNID